ncbi:LAGLIDADG family homing endonuclease [Leucobacter sp. HY1910]
MAAPKQSQPSPSPTPFVLAVAVVASLAATYFMLPGALVLWLGMLIAAAMAQPPQLTGPKDPMTQYPGPGNPGEQRKLNSYRFWQEMKGALWLPEVPWPVTWSQVAGLGVAAMVFTLPTTTLAPEWAWVNAVAAYLLITKTAATKRRFAAEGDLKPATEVATLVKRASGSGAQMAQVIITAAAAILVGGGVMVAAIVYDWYLVWPHAVLAAGAGITAAAIFGHAFVVKETLTPWRETSEARAEWKSRFESMAKVKEFPRLVSHRRIGAHGEGRIDVFEAPASEGARNWIPMPVGVEPTLPPNTLACFKSTPDVDAEGQPITVSRSALRFQALTWRGDQTPDITMPEIEPDVLTAFLDLYVSKTAIDDFGADYELIATGPPEALHADGSQTAAWKVEYAFPAADYDVAHSVRIAAEKMRMHLGVEAYSQGSALYVGAVTAETTELRDSSIIEELEAEAERTAWNTRWTDMASNLQAPSYRPEMNLSSSVRVTSHSSPLAIERRVFLTPNGGDPETYFAKVNVEQLRTALDAKPWAAMSHYTDARGRFPGALAVYFSEVAIPRNPADISPAGDQPERATRARPGGRPGAKPAVPEAALWAITGALNEGFNSAKLTRPEVLRVEPLTDRTSGTHIWSLIMRLHKGVTAADVKRNAERIRQTLGCDWFRVTEHRDGCQIVCGASPTHPRVRFATPEQEQVAASLDWEQAFLDSKIASTDGRVPQLTKMSTLPKNELVKQITFTMPPGVDLAKMRDKIGMLSSATNNAFLDIQQGQEAKEAVVRAAVLSPMPKLAPFDWDEIHASNAAPFATNIEGEPVSFSPKKMVHALILGGSGSGKQQPLSTRIPVPVSTKYPRGWATVGDLDVGDTVYGAHGETARITSFTDTRTEPVYVFELSDGQEVRSSAHHLWPVRSISNRKKLSGERGHCTAVARQKLLDEAARFRRRAIEVGPEVGATAPQIAELAGISYTQLRYAEVLHEDLQRTALIPTQKSAQAYDMTRALEEMTRVAHQRGAYRIDGHQWTAQDLSDLELDGQWLPICTLADVLVRGDSSRVQRKAVRAMIDRAGALARPGTAWQRQTVYPADEILTLLAGAWEVRAAGHAPAPVQVVRTEEIVRRLHSERGGANWSIDLAAAIEGEDIDLPLDPYVLGVWLGDGSSGTGAITSMDTEIIDRVVEAGFTVSSVRQKSNTLASTYRHDRLWASLRTLGLEELRTAKGSIKLNKRIPATYLRASRTQRLELLQGLMDTDGTIGEGNSSCEFSVTHEGLAHDFLELARTLGIKAGIRSSPASYTLEDGSRVFPGSTRYRVIFTTMLPVFKLTRQINRLPAQVRSTQERLYIINVRVEKSEPQRCLRIDSPSHVYLTDGFVPTHNSAAIQAILTPAAIRGWELWILDSVKGAADFKFLEPYAKGFATKPETVAEALRLVYEEVVRRKDMNSQYGVSHVSDLPAAVRPRQIVVMIDELLSAVTKDPVPKTTGQEGEDELRDIEEKRALNMVKAQIGTILGRISREARSAGVTLISASQSLTKQETDGVPGVFDVKKQAGARILLGKSNYGQRMGAFNDPDSAPDLGEDVPRGRGIMETPEGAPVVLQSWFDGRPKLPNGDDNPDVGAEHMESMLRQIAGVRDPETDTLRDADLMPKNAGIDVFGAVITEPELDDEAHEEEVVDLGELEIDLDFDFSFDDDEDGSGGREVVPEAQVEVEPEIEAEPELAVAPLPEPVFDVAEAGAAPPVHVEPEPEPATSPAPPAVPVPVFQPLAPPVSFQPLSAPAARPAPMTVPEPVSAPVAEPTPPPPAVPAPVTPPAQTEAPKFEAAKPKGPVRPVINIEF